MNLISLKYIHIVSVAASFALFFIRGLWAIRSYPQPQEALVRVLPHVVDGCVLLSGIGMLVVSPGGWPGNWLTIKLLLVVAYAGLAHYLLRVAHIIGLKFTALVMALVLFLFITTVAVLRNSAGIFSVI